MNSDYEILEWDSNFFGFRVGKIINPTLSVKELSKLLKYLNSLQVKLIYYLREKELEDPESMIIGYQVKLVDRKTTYIKYRELLRREGQESAVSVYEKDYPEMKLQRLAIESGVYSRFNVDKAITDQKFRELYKLWIVNSVNKKLANETFVYRVDDEIAGLITLGEKNGRADIGIVAVVDSYRGKGIGKSLVLAGEIWSVKQGYKSLQVVTQYTNQPACRLYNSCGFSLESINNFYHLWQH